MRIIRKNTDVDYEKLKSGYSAGYKDGIAHSKELIRGQAEQIKELQQKLIETTNAASKWKIKYMEMENKLRGEVHELLKRQSKSKSATKPIVDDLPRPAWVKYGRNPEWLTGGK